MVTVTTAAENRNLLFWRFKRTNQMCLLAARKQPVFLMFLQTKNANVLGFCWTNWNEIVFITDQGIEFYQVRRPGRLYFLFYVRKRVTCLLLFFFRCFQTSAA